MNFSKIPQDFTMSRQQMSKLINDYNGVENTPEQYLELNPE